MAWTSAAAARRAYADLVDPVVEAGREHESTMCGDWTVHHVTGHLVSFVDVGLPSFMLNLARHRFDYDAAADTLARKVAERPMGELISRLREKASKSSALPMFPESMTVMDVVVHTQDVRRGLGLDGTPAPELVGLALGFLATHKQASQVVPKGVYDGLRLEASDIDWCHGSGQLVCGPAEPLLMAMAGRAVYDELDGDGVTTLQVRFAD